MANFNTHITTSTAIGAIYGIAGHTHWDIPIPTCLVAAGLCSVAGMLPDVDSDSGRPQREVMSFAATVTPMLMIDRFAQLGLSHESMVLAGGCVYILVRFGFGELLQRYTVHRGMWHSIPAAVVAGLVAWLICSCEDVSLRIFKVAAVMIGYITHLVLDELWALRLHRGRLRIRRSFGTALKFFSRHWWPNVSTYGNLLLLGALAFGDPLIMERYAADPSGVHQMARDWVDHILKELLAVQ